MRDYGKVSPQFWVGETGKQIRALGPECQVVALYLMSSPHANMLGLYYLPIVLLSHETGIPFEGASEALRSLSEVGYCSYDEASEVVWVHEMARFQIGESLKENDKRVSGVRSALKNVPKNNLIGAWLERYGEAFHISPTEAPSKPLRSQEQEQEQEQKKNNPPCIPPGGSAGKPPPAKSKKFTAKDMALPPGVDPDNWREWCEFRSSKRKPVSEKAAAKQVALLAQHSPTDQRTMVQQSIQNDWQGLFPPKGGTHADDQRNPSRNSAVGRVDERIRQRAAEREADLAGGRNADDDPRTALAPDDPDLRPPVDERLRGGSDPRVGDGTGWPGAGQHTPGTGTHG